ncbi:carbamoyltransferase [Synergistales bacterium]|nr:carbamoyltransferase [Synergistales bacterium]
MRNNYIIGLNIGNHDSAAALLKNGEVVSYVEQERFSRNKLAEGEAPIDALYYCLRKEGISLSDAEAIALGMDWGYRNKKYQLTEEQLKTWATIDVEDRYLPKDIFGDFRPPIYRIRHHIAHAASACRLSGFGDSAVLVVDNRGESESASLGIAKNGEISFFKKIDIRNSLGIFYNRACEFTGLYGKYREVGKFMGLASYGIPNMTMPVVPDRNGELFKNLPDVSNATIHDSITLRSEQLLSYFKENCFPYEAGNVEEIMSYANFAASAQKTLEDVLIDFITELKEKTGLDNLVIAGGIALNCSVNGKLERSGLFRHIYIPPFASDAGTSVGAALELNYRLHGKAKTDKPMYLAGLGASYSDKQTLKELESYNEILSWNVFNEDNLEFIVAKELSYGKIVAWMQGGFEAGPRALGNRSILADPRTRKSLIRLNHIKEREMWRPIAPSVLEEYYEEYFTGYSDNKYFMNIAAFVKKDKQKLIPAVVHVDETARPQLVIKENEKYYKLLSAFMKETGIPVVCNTSFNIKGKPLVNTPKNAIECFLRRGIDMLVIDNVIVKKIRG